MPPSYFRLEVFAHDVACEDGPGSSSSLPPPALAFQFLDYPLLLVYASGSTTSTTSSSNPSSSNPASAAAQRSGVTEGGSGGGGAPPSSAPLLLHQFSSGKSCVIQADLEEMQFLLDEVGGVDWN